MPTFREQLTAAYDSIRKRQFISPQDVFKTEPYPSPKEMFKIIQNELLKMGVFSHIENIRLSTLKHKPGRRWNVSINFQIVGEYKTSRSAKARILRHYLKLLEDGTKEKATKH